MIDPVTKGTPTPALNQDPQWEPYVGPCPYNETHVSIFFGRKREADDLLSLVIAHADMLLYARSGAGKTSLIQAALVPRLRREARSEVLNTRIHGRLKGFDPPATTNLYVFHSLLSWQDSSNTEFKSLVTMSMSEYLRARPRPRDEEGFPLPRVLVFDQFEELFTAYPQQWHQRRAFFEQLRDALKEDPHLHVLFAMREDHIAQLDPYSSVLPEHLRTRYRLEPLRRRAALAAVTKPLDKATPQHKFGAGVAEKLVDDLLRVEMTVDGTATMVIEEFVEPVQLQIVCQNLWHRLPRVATEITEELLETSANVNVALTHFYERCIGETMKRARVSERALRRWFNKELITPACTRGLVFRDNQQTGSMPNRAVDELEKRYLIKAEVRGEQRWYELAHDRFIRPVMESNEPKLSRLKYRKRLAVVSLAMLTIALTLVLAFLWNHASNQERLSNYEKTLTKYQGQIIISDKVTKLAEEAETLRSEAQKRSKLGDEARDEEHFDRAIAAYQQALALYQKSLELYGTAIAKATPQDDEPGLQWISLVKGNLVKVKQEQSILYEKLGKIGLDYGDNEKALSFYAAALESDEERLKVEPEKVLARQKLACSYINMSRVHLKLGDVKRAGEYVTKCERVCHELKAKESISINEDVAARFNDLAELSLDVGDSVQALEYAMKRLDICRAMLGDQSKLADAFASVGQMCFNVGRIKEGIEAYRSFGTTKRAGVEAKGETEQARILADVHETLGRAYNQINAADISYLHWWAANDRARQLMSSKDRESERVGARTYEWLGDLSLQLGDATGAMDYCRKSVDLLSQVVADNPDLYFGRLWLAWAQLKVGRTTAIDLESMLKMREQVVKANPKLIKAQSQLADAFYQASCIHWAVGDGTEAVKAAEGCKQLREELMHADPKGIEANRSLALALLQLGKAQLTLNTTNVAKNNYLRAIEILRQLAGRDPQNVQRQIDLAYGWGLLGRAEIYEGQSEDGFVQGEKALKEEIAILDALITKGKIIGDTNRNTIRLERQLCDAATIAIENKGNLQSAVNAAVQSGPRSELIIMLAIAKVREGNHEEMMRAADDIRAQGKDPINLYTVARCFALCVREAKRRAQGKDSEESIKYAQSAVEELNGAARSGFEDFALLLRDPDLDIIRKEGGYRALIERGKADPCPLLLAMANVLRTGDGALHVSAENVISRIGADAVGKLGALLEKPNEFREVKMACLKCLAVIGLPAKDAVNQLTKAIGDPDRQARMMAARALGNSGSDGKAVEDALIMAEKDADSNVQKVAKAALIQLRADKVVTNFRVEGVLTKDDPFDTVRVKSHRVLHACRMKAGQVYTIDVLSDAATVGNGKNWDNFLRLENAQGVQLDQDDDSGGQLNARIVFRAPEDGWYRIIVTSYVAGVSGDYILAVRQQQPGKPE
jgi:tetratricopeptide (TPR) repeat protein